MGWKIIVIIILVCQFPLSVLSLHKLFKLKYKTGATIAWNVTIMAVPFVGALVFWTVMAIKSLAEKKNYEKPDK